MSKTKEKKPKILIALEFIMGAAEIVFRVLAWACIILIASWYILPRIEHKFGLIVSAIGLIVGGLWWVVGGVGFEKG